MQTTRALVKSSATLRPRFDQGLNCRRGCLQSVASCSDRSLSAASAPGRAVGRDRTQTSFFGTVDATIRMNALPRWLEVSLDGFCDPDRSLPLYFVNRDHGPYTAETHNGSRVTDFGERVLHFGKLGSQILDRARTVSHRGFTVSARPSAGVGTVENGGFDAFCTQSPRQ